MCVEIEGALLSQLNFGYVCHHFRANKIANMYPIQHTVYTYTDIWYYIWVWIPAVFLSTKILKNLFYSFRVQAVHNHSGVSKAVLQIIISWQITIPKHEFTVCWENSLTKPLFLVTAGGLVTLIWAKRNCSEINQAKQVPNPFPSLSF